MRVRASSRQSLAMKLPPPVSARRASTTGWRPPSISMQGSLTNSGRHQPACVRARPAQRQRVQLRPGARQRSAERGQVVLQRSSTARRASFSRASAPTFLRRQRLVLEGLQLGRDEALGVLQRLAALVVARHLVRPRPDLDVKPCTLLNCTRRLAMPVRARSRVPDRGRRRSSAPMPRSSSSSASKPGAITPPSRHGRLLGDGGAAAPRPAGQEQRRATADPAAAAPPRLARRPPLRQPCQRAAQAGQFARARTWRSAMRGARSTSLTPRSARAAARSRGPAAPRWRRGARRRRSRHSSSASSMAQRRLPCRCAAVEQAQQRGRISPRSVCVSSRLRCVAGGGQQLAGSAPPACAHAPALALRVLGKGSAAPRRQPAPRQVLRIEAGQRATRSCSQQLALPSGCRTASPGAGEAARAKPAAPRCQLAPSCSTSARLPGAHSQAARARRIQPGQLPAGQPSQAPGRSAPAMPGEPAAACRRARPAVRCRSPCRA